MIAHSEAQESGRAATACRPIKTILIGYDGSEGAEHAFARALDLAGQLAARLVVATIEQPLVPADAGLYGGVIPVPLPSEPLEGDELLAQRLDRVRLAAERRGIDCELALSAAPPAEGIIELADQHEADLIVVGTHEPGLLERLFLGRVSQTVTRQAHRDVLVVHHQRRPDKDAQATELGLQ